MKTIKSILTAVGVFAFATQAFATFVGGSGYRAQTYYENPHADETFAAFDWDADTNLYYSTGRPGYGLGMSVYRYNETTVANLYTATNVYAGSRVTVIGDFVYFNDGDNYNRSTNDYFKYAPATGLAPTRIIDSVGTGIDLWGLQARGSSAELWAAGGGSCKIQYTTLDASGNPVSVPPISLAQIGNYSGPLAFDVSGNLYYANGYVGAGDPNIFRWSAAEVVAAKADPVGSPLSPTGHEWAMIVGGFSGSGMACDDNGNVILTATSFGSPSEVRLYSVNAAGANSGMTVIATTPNRAETVRYRDGVIYVSDADGIAAVAEGASGWDVGFQDLGDGWRRLAWFGDYVPMGQDGWIWHNRHGFLYVPPNAEPESIWLYAQDMGWLWTGNATYPFLYRHSDGAWLWYNGAVNPRWFRNMTTGQWESRP